MDGMGAWVEHFCPLIRIFLDNQWFVGLFFLVAGRVGRVLAAEFKQIYLMEY